MSKKIHTKKIEALFQIVVLISAIFAFSYFSGKVFGNNNEQETTEKNKTIEIYQSFVEKIFGKNIVSAQNIDETDFVNELADFGVENLDVLPQDGLIGRIWRGLRSFNFDSGRLQQILSESAGDGISVCIEMKSGSKCQIMKNSECGELCESGQCVEIASSPDENIDNDRMPEQCKLGTCQDLEEGTCVPNAMKGYCEEYSPNAQWYDDENGNVPECVRGCCSLGDERDFTTGLQCEKNAEDNGLIFGENAFFDSSIQNYQVCLALSSSQEVVACTFEDEEAALEGKFGCKITTREECNSIGGVADEEKRLCSHPELNTICEAKHNTACDDELNGVYWFDSCGNRENIVDLDMEDGGWNGGYILEKSESCSLREGDNLIGNQDTCGNCDRAMTSSVCSVEDEKNELNDEPDGGFVCRDLGCYEEVNGETIRREHGETWCAYQTNFGVFPADIPGVGVFEYFSGGLDFAGGIFDSRSVAPVGSQYFRKSCVDGNVTIEACQDARRSICVETREQMENSDREISVASCRPNRWQECLNYNPTGKGENAIGSKIEVARAMLKCEKDPDCFVKGVNVDKDFKFPVCLPKYPPGFTLGENAGGGEGVCGFASQTCPVVFVKKSKAGGFGGVYWEKVVNGDCVEGETPETAKPSQKFVTEMNDFCSSLGDCGMKINYKGSPGGFSGVTNSLSFKKCVTEDVEGECKRKTPVIPSGTGIAALAAKYGVQIINDLNAGNKYIDANNIEELQNSVGASTQNGGGIPGVGGDLSVPEGPGWGLPAVAAVPGALALGSYTLGKTAFSTLTTSLGKFGSFAAAEQAASAAGATQYEIYKVGETQFVASYSTPTMNPGFASFGWAMTTGAIAMAAAGLLVSLTGIGRGLGTGWSYFYSGTAFVGGATTYLGFGQGGAALTNLLGEGAAPFIPFLKVLGPIVLVVTFTMIALNIIWGVGQVKKVEVSAECKSWQPPVGAGDEVCGQCGEDGFPCNDYACNSLGANCKIVGDAPNLLCASVSQNDIRGPGVVPGNAPNGWEIIENENGFEIINTESNSECLENYQTIPVEVKLDETGECSIGLDENLNYEEMLSSALTSSQLTRAGEPHIFQISSESIFAYFEEIGEPINAEEEREIKLYIKCVDVNGNPSQEKIVQFCVVRADWTPPILSHVSDREFYPFGTEEAEIRVHSNEPVEMRWSFEDKPFDEMENIFNCPQTSGAIDCNANVQMSENNIVIYVRARDHPEWVGTDREIARNTNQESLIVNLQKTETALEINSVKPSDGETIYTNLNKVSVDVEVSVSGGIPETTVCYVGNGRADTLEKDGNIFKANYERYSDGEHILIIECEDSAGNLDREEVTFNIIIDTSVPEITRVYEENDRIFVVTNVPAECSYLTNTEEKNCGFNFDDGNLMEIESESEGYLHSADFDYLREYYIKCKNVLDNAPSNSCSIIVSGSDV